LALIGQHCEGLNEGRKVDGKPLLSIFAEAVGASVRASRIGQPSQAHPAQAAGVHAMCIESSNMPRLPACFLRGEELDLSPMILASSRLVVNVRF
jgi:hypothetical protein